MRSIDHIFYEIIKKHNFTVSQKLWLDLIVFNDTPKDLSNLATLSMVHDDCVRECFQKQIYRFVDYYENNKR